MSEALIKIDSDAKDAEALTLAGNNSSFLRRMQFMSAKADLCQAGKFPINHFGITSGEEVQDLGEQVNCIPLAYRPLAIDSKAKDGAIVCLTPNLDAQGKCTGEFARIQELAEVSNSGAMSGVQFLVWIPDIREFATFFLFTKTARQEIKPMAALIGRGASVKGRFIDGKFKYWSPKVIACSIPMEIPEEAEMRAQIEKFKNPPKPTVIAASAAEQAATADRG